jgi:nitroreductase
VEFAEVVRRRKMIRSYLDRPVDPDSVERIVDAARRSPSAGHSQGQYLIVVTDPDTRRAIAELGNERTTITTAIGSPTNFRTPGRRSSGPFPIGGWMGAQR